MNSLKCCAWWCLLIFGVSGCGQFGGGAPQFEIRLTGPRAEGDSIRVSRAKPDGVLFTVESEMGIGRAVIRPTESNWPEHISFQMNLGGLESLVVKGESIYRTERRDDGSGDGYLIKLPDGVTGTGSDPVEVAWVDFYRN